MRRRVASVALALCAAMGGLVFAHSAQAQMYWRLDVGGSMTDDASFGPVSTDSASSYVVGGGVGYRFNPSLRGDATLNYRGSYKLEGTDGSGAVLKADLTSTSLMANGYWDLPLSGTTPYIGAGIGWAQNKLDAFGGTWSGGAYALMAGFTMQLSGHVLDIGFRYADLGKIESAAGNGKLKAHELSVGLRF